MVSTDRKRFREGGRGEEGGGRQRRNAASRPGRQHLYLVFRVERFACEVARGGGRPAAWAGMEQQRRVAAGGYGGGACANANANAMPGWCGG